MFSLNRSNWAILGTVAVFSLFLFFIFNSFSLGFVRGSSMYPVLKDGDFIFLKTGSVTIASGDVIGYQPDQFTSPIAHRVVMVYPGLNYVLVKGDNSATNPWIDPLPVFSSEVIGKVVCRFRLPFLT